MAETLRRRYSRLVKEAAEAQPAAADEDNAATAAESPIDIAPIFAPSQGESPAPTVAPLSGFPNLILIDGGKGQLNAACAELAKLGLSHLPIIGLAKEFEEIYRTG